jgi:hypothetical protein
MTPTQQGLYIAGTSYLLNSFVLTNNHPEGEIESGGGNAARRRTRWTKFQILTTFPFIFGVIKKNEK